MTLPEFAGCPWPIDEGCCTDWNDYSDDVQDRAVVLASITLERLTGFRVRNCPVKVRPCRQDCGSASLYPVYAGLYSGALPNVGWYPFIDVTGSWVSGFCGCGSRGNCSCTQMCSVDLPGPVGRIDEVKVNGSVVDPTKYRQVGNSLVWADPDNDCEWPLCQDLSLADTEDKTMSVTYVNGHVPDSLGAYAAGILACEFAKACTGGKCRLPAGVTNVVRQGVAITLAVTFGFTNGFTGIQEVDAYIAAWNPYARKQPSTIYSPDMIQPVFE